MGTSEGPFRHRQFSDLASTELLHLPLPLPSPEHNAAGGWSLDNLLSFSPELPNTADRFVVRQADSEAKIEKGDIAGIIERRQGWDPDLKSTSNIVSHLQPIALQKTAEK
ncbi:hypothetical protein P7K49_030792 [Saguinus oedipus]|uniref:Uncharacterized protein n=1 Tax=Saguinus oedipus TaxID=9490 RepID=A0ABQ9U4C7_SAGOE|nr:hypothetical protein P7K49_030792 [Saguinus oedipus]